MTHVPQETINRDVKMDEKQESKDQSRFFRMAR